MNSNSLPWVLLAVLLLYLAVGSIAKADGYEFKSYMMSETVTLVTTNQPCMLGPVSGQFPLFAYRRISLPDVPVEYVAGCYTERGIETIIRLMDSDTVLVVPTKNFQIETMI